MIKIIFVVSGFPLGITNPTIEVTRRRNHRVKIEKLNMLGALNKTPLLCFLADYPPPLTFSTL